MPEEVVVKVHPPTAGVGVLCIDGGTRGVLPLKFMKRIEDRIGLPIPLQKFFKVAFGISSADGLYPAENIEAALQAVFGKEKTILDYSHATSIFARVGLPVATIREPSSCIFTNYNGVGTRDQDQGYHVIRPEDGYGKVPLWEMQVFPAQKNKWGRTFQDAGPLENDPLISALSEVAAMFPLVEEPDFMVSLGTGAPRTTGGKPSMSVSGPLSVWKDGAFPRLWRMFWERMRDRHVKQVFRTHPRYHRLDIEFDEEMPRLTILRVYMNSN
ncbi:hypothetical protein DL95DRAFT_419207 [Leptodontidium sp. 2 PMI_412]|nr:hypothetical protein DL95DRAFT_419207 [Leptodontidium sp. 2 PMI_412]